MRTSSIFWRLASNFLAQFTIISLLLQQFIFVYAVSAYADELPITPDGTTNTQIDRAANNVPIVNIAAPNSSGLSHNKFENYNVNQSGLILNNAIGSPNGVIQTQIGGLINDNANLVGSGAASVILNEVTSNNVSQIMGYTEIAGRKADLILANPNGFVFNGGGFINVSRFSAVVGSANQFNPNPNDLTFRLSDNAYAVTHGFLPKLTIMGSGIDLENITSTDLVANVMNIVAPIYAGDSEVNLRAGDLSFNYLNKTVTSDNTAPGSNLPDEVAIDASTLGKIQAGRIFIIATKEGFGIKYSGDLLASRAGVIIDNQGNIEYNNIASQTGNIEVTSQKGAITQRGIVQTKNSSSDIVLNARGDISNYGQFLSARNISLTTSANFSNQSSDLNLSQNDFIISAVGLTNLGQISANRDLDITASASLNNSAKLVAGRNLILTAPQITNEDSIYAGNKITISAANYLTNNKDIISLGLGVVENEDGSFSGDAEDGILITAKTLNNNKKIAAKNNIIINSNSLNNNTANSSILALKNLDLNVVTLDNSRATLEGLNNLTLRNLTLNASTIAASFGASQTNVAITNDGGTFFARNLLDFDLGNLATYTITGNLQSAKDLKIKASNITNLASIQAGGAIEITALDTFVNGVLSGDNTNNKIIASTNLSITAANLLSNYGKLSAKNNLTLTSVDGNINNNANAEIIGGTGKLTIAAKNGTVYQNSLHSIVANGDYSLDVVDFVNTGRVDVAGDLILNVGNDLTNEAGALIYAGGTMQLNVVHNLTNKTGAVIYSEGDLTIQKYARLNADGSVNPLYNAANNRINKLDNLSGEITSYSGDINIFANEINNKRTSIYTQTVNRYINNCSFHHHETHCALGEDASYSGTITASAKIYAGNNLNINSIYNVADMVGSSLTNQSSSIVAKNDINVRIGSFNNNSNSFKSYNKYLDQNYWWWGHSDPNIRTDELPYMNLVEENFPASFKAGGSIDLRTNSNISNQDVVRNTPIDAAFDRNPDLVDGVDIGDLLNNGVVNLDLSSYFNGPENQGLFTKNPNPNGPLFETRSEFIDQSKFFGSNYFYTRIGLNLTDVQTEFEQQSKRLVGDQFFQTKIIEEQLRTISKNNFLLSAGETNVNNEIKNLIDNAADEYARLGLTTNSTLTQGQINNLQKDIIWFETETIDGAAYIVPKVYLSQATRDNLKNNLNTNATIAAGGDVNLNSQDGKITNQGTIVASNIDMVAAGDIVNKNFSEISALNNLTITSTEGSIKNFSQISAGGTASIAAAKDVTNSATVITNDADLLNSGNSAYIQNSADARSTGQISSKLVETAGITAGALVVNAGENFNNVGSSIDTTGNASITAGNDVNVSSVALRNRSETTWGTRKKGGSEIVDTATNIGSDVNIGGNLTAVTTGLGLASEQQNIDNLNAKVQEKYNQDLANYNRELAQYNASPFHKGTPPTKPQDPTLYEAASSNINITGSNVTTNQNLNLQAKDEVNITSSLDSSYKYSETHKKGSTVQKSSVDVKVDVVNNNSNLNANGAININSGSDTSIIASNLTAADSSIIVGKYIDNNPLSPTYGQELINNDAELTIKSGQDYHYHYHQDTKIKTDSTAVVVGAAAAVAAVALAPVSGGASLALYAGAAGSGAVIGAQGKKGKTATSETTQVNQVQSSIDIASNLNIQSAADTTIIASNLSADRATILTGRFKDGGTDIITNPDAKINIQSELDFTKTENTTTRIKPNYVGIAAVAFVSSYASTVAGDYLTSPVPSSSSGMIGPQIPIISGATANMLTGAGVAYTGNSLNSNISPNQKSFMDPILNIRTKNTSSTYKETEIKTNLNFNNLITE